MNIIVFEDGRHDDYYPLSQTRPLWDLRLGLFSMRERAELAWRMRYPNARFYYFTREALAGLFRERYPESDINNYSVFDEDGDFVFLNAMAYPPIPPEKIEKEFAIIKDDEPLIARCARRWAKGPLPLDDIAGIYTGLNTFNSADTGVGLIEHIWDLVVMNKEAVKYDYSLAGYTGGRSNAVTIIGESSQVYIDEGARIDPFVVIDASGGPVYIGKRSVVHSFTRIEGPASIGADCVVLGAKIREGVSIGDCCRIGGEIEESIIHGRSNKYHDGFLGHSYIGEWVNIGAETSNSDLKNNYSPIKVYLSGTRKKTGLRKMGCFMGDFVKTSLGTLINTGTSIGTGAMLVCPGSLTPPHIPPFYWFIDGRAARVSWIEDFFRSCGEAMGRRGVAFSESHRALLASLYEQERGE